MSFASNSKTRPPQLKFCKTTFATPNVFEISFRDSKTYNALNREFFEKFPSLLNWIATNKNIYVVLVNSTSKHFSSGIDVKLLAGLFKPQKHQDPARISIDVRSSVKAMQESIHLFAKIPQPVIMEIDGSCIGAGVDIICAGDIRLCSRRAKFCIKEVCMGLVPDIGTMSRLHKICGNDSQVRELCYTGRNFGCEEALQLGLVSNIYENKDELHDNALKLAKTIASKSPIAVRGVKELSNYALDHPVEELNNYVAIWNGSMLQTQDVAQSAMAFFTKKKPVYSKL